MKPFFFAISLVKVVLFLKIQKITYHNCGTAVFCHKKKTCNSQKDNKAGVLLAWCNYFENTPGENQGQGSMLSLKTWNKKVLFTSKASKRSFCEIIFKILK